MAQKKTNDVDYSMQEKIMALYELQKIDSQIDEINKVKGELPLEVQDLEDELAGLNTRIENINAEIEELNSLTRQRKREVDQAKIMIANYKEQQNNVRNNREFDALTKEIEEQTGVETRFVRLAHVVRGGNPSLTDRVLGSTMGAIAVEELLKGNSDLVVCDRRGKVVTEDIKFALILDRMYKAKLKDGDLDQFSPEEVARMTEEVKNKRAAMARLYGISRTINL